MYPDYVKDVRRFGSAKPFEDATGVPFNLSHDDDICPCLVVTNGKGNVDSIPLVFRKRCIGRPERFARGRLGGMPWRDDNARRRPGKTPCDTCRTKSPGTFEACRRICDERIESSPAIKFAFDAWLDECLDVGPHCFLGSRMKLWDRFLQAIIDHGGWSNVNDDQAKLEALRLKDYRAKRRKENRRQQAQDQKAARLGTAKPITLEYIKALEAEREKRASHLKRLGKAQGRTKQDMLWLKMLKDDVRDRIAEVWATREMLRRMAREATGQTIAKAMMARRAWAKDLPSLRARVYDDLKRLARLEDDTAGEPLWEKWAYS